jgi:hypothetical protein
MATQALQTERIPRFSTPQHHPVIATEDHDTVSQWLRQDRERRRSEELYVSPLAVGVFFDYCYDCLKFLNIFFFASLLAIQTLWRQDNKSSVCRYDGQIRKSIIEPR